MTEIPQLPVACTLTSSQIESGREGLLPGLVSRAKRSERLSDGFRWYFDTEEGLLRQAGAVLEAEHSCCQFLRFKLLVEPGRGAIVLEATGPDGTPEFLESLLGAA
ncbi:MAG: hypothetical protein AAF389_12555 [Gemmatimonadota bacterium]